MAKMNYKKILPKTNTGDIIEGFGFAGGPRGFSRSKPIKEVQTTPKKSLQNQKVIVETLHNLINLIGELHNGETSKKEEKSPKTRKRIKRTRNN